MKTLTELVGRKLGFDIFSLLDVVPVDGEEEMADADGAIVPCRCHIKLRSYKYTGRKQKAGAGIQTNHGLHSWY